MEASKARGRGAGGGLGDRMATAGGAAAHMSSPQWLVAMMMKEWMLDTTSASARLATAVA